MVVADPAQCSFQFDPIGKARFTSSCDIAKTGLTRAGVPYENLAAPAGAIAEVRVGSVTLRAFDGSALAPVEFRTRAA